MHRSNSISDSEAMGTGPFQSCVFFFFCFLFFVFLFFCFFFVFFFVCLMGHDFRVIGEQDIYFQTLNK